jgi:hypothetical protein
MVSRTQREALALARQLGCRVEWMRRTGEIMVSHPAIDARLRTNGRRKDASRRLTAFIERVRRTTTI